MRLNIPGLSGLMTAWCGTYHCLLLFVLSISFSPNFWTYQFCKSTKTVSSYRCLKDLSFPNRLSEKQKSECAEKIWFESLHYLLPKVAQPRSDHQPIFSFLQLRISLLSSLERPLTFSRVVFDSMLNQVFLYTQPVVLSCNMTRCCYLRYFMVL